MAIRANAWNFVKGFGSALVGAGAVYFVCDSLSEIVTLRDCQQQTLALATRHEGLCKELGPPLTAGPLYSSSMTVSPSGRLVKCQFTILGASKSSDVTATVQRPPYPSSFLYNVAGPSKWELVNCHVLVGGEDTLVRAVNLMRVGGEQPSEADRTEPLPPHLFKEQQSSQQ